MPFKEVDIMDIKNEFVLKTDIFRFLMPDTVYEKEIKKTIRNDF